MSVVIATLDQVPGSQTIEGPRLTFKVGQITAREIIRARVQAEVGLYNGVDAPRSYNALVAPAPDEQQLNGSHRERRRPLDAEAQISVAIEAVVKRRVIILFNGAQVDDLDAPLLVTPVSEARFLKLVPLVGG